VSPTPLLNPFGATVRTLSLVGACDLKRKIQILRCDLLTKIQREETAEDVLTRDLPVNEVGALACPVHAVTDDKIRAVACLRFDAVGVLVDALNLITVREHFPSPNLPRFQLNCQIPDPPTVPIDINR